MGRKSSAPATIPPLCMITKKKKKKKKNSIWIEFLNWNFTYLLFIYLQTKTLQLLNIHITFSNGVTNESIVPSSTKNRIIIKIIDKRLLFYFILFFFAPFFAFCLPQIEASSTSLSIRSCLMSKNSGVMYGDSSLMCS